MENNVAVKQRIKLSLGLCVAVIAFVALKPASAAIWECGERSNLPPEGKNYCAAGDFRLADAELAMLFEQLLEIYQSSFEESAVLQQAQEAYLRYRQNHCIAENRRVLDKSYYDMMVAQCQTRLTNLRIDELQNILTRLPRE